MQNVFYTFLAWLCLSDLNYFNYLAISKKEMKIDLKQVARQDLGYLANAI